MRILEHRQMTSIYIKLGVIILAAVIYFFVPGVRNFVNDGISFLHYRDFDGLRSFILAYGIWAPVTSIALMVLQSMVPVVPGLIITITNAWIFGWEYGALYSWTGALTGALLDFILARWYGRPLAEKFVDHKYLDLINGFFKRHGVLAVFVTRLTPVVPFKVVSYGSGLTAISLFKFAVATAVGQTPAIVLYSILGQNLLYNVYAIIGSTLLLMAVAGCIFYYRGKIEDYLSKNKEEH